MKRLLIALVLIVACNAPTSDEPIGFEPTFNCPQCGREFDPSAGAGVDPQMAWVCDPRYDPPCELSRALHLHSHCLVCGYEWITLPAGGQR